MSNVRSLKSVRMEKPLNRKQAFLKANPNCVFCGGTVAATTIEHCPPRAMFQNRQWPEGHEFPSCEDCNNGTDDQDLLVAMVARMDPIEEKGNSDGKAEGLMMMANRQFPGLLANMRLSAIEARRRNRELGLKPAPGQTHQDVGATRVPAELHNAICVFAGKLAKGIFYLEASSIFPVDGCLLLNWFTNADIFRSGKYQAFELLKEINGNAPSLQRSGKDLNDQFEYKLSMATEKTTFVLQCRFGNSFGFVIFGSTVPGLLEAGVIRLREQTKREGPFVVLQSSSLS
jgi:hypothetical protein